MSMAFKTVQPFLHALPPECAHRLGIFALRHKLIPPARDFSDTALSVRAFGLQFPNPVGLAAGFDKNAEAITPLLAQGFGFVEAGTVTPKPQPGNSKPRIFRLREDEAIINRLGFNNHGLAVFTRNFSKRGVGIAGANIGKNKDSADAQADYITGLEAVYSLADYITINISSPNTQGLRDLQKADALDALLGTLAQARARCQALHEKRVPLLLKVAPDLEMAEKEAISALVISHGMDGLIVSNTTISRPALKSPHAGEQGGLSGKPLFALSTAALSDFYRLTAGKIPLVGVGGIASSEDAYAKIQAGASLVQLYSALAYQGFGLVRDIQKGLVERLKRDGFSTVSAAVGTKT